MFWILRMKDMGFQVTAINVLVMLFYLSIGYVLAKCNKAVDTHARTISSLLLYVCGPAMIISAFNSLSYNSDDFINMSLFFGITLVIQIIIIVILYLILRKKYDDAKYRLLTFGAACGNVGFFGLPLVNALFPDKPIVSCYSSAYVMSMNIIAFTLGVYLITQNKKYVSLKSAILNPTTIAMIVAVPLYLLNFHFPSPIDSTLSLLGKMTTPLCMIILGLRLSSMKFKDVFCKPFAYLCCLLKLVIFPLFGYLCVYFIPGLDETFKVCILILSASPSGAIILSLAELHQTEQDLCATITLLATLMCVITIPLLTLIV